jgi:hypothetical protein
VGHLVWNRQRYIKDLTSGKRLARINPPDKWVVRAVPELRIVDDTLWQAVAALSLPKTRFERSGGEGHRPGAGP